MKIVGLVTEYNPFHKGHHYHIETAKKITNSDYCITVMSGNFVQRGDPAIVHKWNRAQSALECGADLVIELPVHYATASAEFFSMAAIALLENTGIVDCICFGSESGDIQILDTIATILANEPTPYKSILTDFLNQGYNFPTARSKALIQYLSCNVDAVINSPNNILGIEYLKALKRLKSPMKPFTIKRMGADYHDKNFHVPVASASAIRKHLKDSEPAENILSKMLPEASYRLLSEAIDNHYAPIFADDFLPLLKFKLITTPPKELDKILDITEGFENRILSTIDTVTSMEALLDALMTKRYTRTKINRALLHILLELDKKSFDTFNKNGYAQYIRVLGFNKNAQHLMKLLKEEARIPIVGNVKASEKNLTSLQKKMLSDEIRATNIYNTVVFSKYRQLLKNDYTQPMIIL